MIEQDYQIIDPVVFPDHVLREDIDECRFYTASGSYGKTWFKIKGLKGKRVQEHSHDYHFRCLKKDHPAATASQTIKPIVLAAAKTYLTAGGYVVKTILYKGCINATKETSPGVSGYGNPVEKCFPNTTFPNIGWGYHKNGTLSLHPEWSEKLRIIEELPFSLPTLPSGYKWLGGYPQFRVPVKSEHFMRYHSKTGFGDVAKCDGNFQVPFGEENRRLIVVATQPKESVVVQPQPLSTEGMVEVTHFKDYIVQKDDVYFPITHTPCSASELPGGPYRVSWYEPTTKLFATKKNYDDYVIRNSPKPEHSVTVTEGPVIGAGYRKIDISLDTPQEGDQVWIQLNNQWLDRSVQYGAFNHINTYRRLVSNDYVTLDPKIYGDHIPRTGDQYKKQDYTKWESMTGDTYEPIKHWAKLGYVFRCKKENVPVVNKLTTADDFGDALTKAVSKIPDRADAAQISGVACATPPNKVSVQVQENEMSNSSTNTETVKFETAKKLAVATAKLGGKMIWRTADYFVFAPIKKAASPFMWMVRYAVLGTMVGGGVYACSNPDDAKELLWKCVPKISISIDAPEVLG